MKRPFLSGRTWLMVVVCLAVALALQAPAQGQGSKLSAGQAARAAAAGQAAAPAPSAAAIEPATRKPVPPKPGPPVLIKGATILTVTKGTIPNGSILLRDGKIAAVGQDIEAPPGTEVVDATGKFVSPGIIDEHSHIAADSINEGGTTVSSMTRIEDVFNPRDINIYRNLAGGLTVASVYHGSANPIGGTNSVIKLRWGKTRPEEFLFDAALPGLKFALGENPKDMLTGGRATGPRRYPASRPGVEFVIRDAFTRAREYQRAWQEYERRKKAGEDVIPPRRDIQLDPLVEVLEGRRLTHVHAYRSDEMLMIMRLAEEFGFKVHTFEHGLEGYKIAKELAEHGAGVGTFADWWAYKIEAIDAIPYNAALMMKAGVVVSINSDSAEHARRLPTEAAKMMHWGGLTEDQALALVTINPAKQLKIDSRVGSLEVGKDADIVVWNRHPLSSYATVDRTYIDGTLYYDREKDLARVAEVVREKQRLIAAEKAAKPVTTEPEPVEGPAHLADGEAAEIGPSRDTALYEPQSGPRPRPLMATGVIAITNAKIVPVTRPVIERGTIVIRDGKIEAVGADVKPPAGARVIDAGGGEVYPGWINARTTIGLAEPGASGYQDTTEMLDYNPHLRTVVAYHNDSESIPVARANGVTTVAVVPTGGILGGEVPVMNLDGWTWEESMVRRASGISFQFPSVGGGGRGGGAAPGGEPGAERTYDDLKRQRDRRLEAIIRLFDQARAYAKAAGPDRKVDWVLEALVPVVEGRIPLFTNATREQDIKDAIAFAEKANVRIVLMTGPEAALVAPLLAEKKVPVILGSVLSLPTREDMFHAASYMAAGELARAGVKFAFSTGDHANVRQLPYHAAMSVAWGLGRDEALKALTIDAAEILGVADVMGSIEPGKAANLLIAKGDPLEVRTEVSYVFINGREVDLSNKHLALYERYSKRQ